MALTDEEKSKIVAETAKLIAERDKLHQETRFHRVSWIPSVTALAGITLAVLQFFVSQARDANAEKTLKTAELQFKLAEQLKINAGAADKEARQRIENAKELEKDASAATADRLKVLEEQYSRKNTDLTAQFESKRKQFDELRIEYDARKSAFDALLTASNAASPQIAEARAAGDKADQRVAGIVEEADREDQLTNIRRLLDSANSLNYNERVQAHSTLTNQYREDWIVIGMVISDLSPDRISLINFNTRASLLEFLSQTDVARWPDSLRKEAATNLEQMLKIGATGAALGPQTLKYMRKLKTMLAVQSK